MQRICHTPSRKAKFIKFLQDRTGEGLYFAKEYQNYCDKNEIEPIFNTTLIKGDRPEPKPDEDKHHAKCYEKIEFRSYSYSQIDERLRDLYNALVENGFISKNTIESLFVYRFTGFLPSFKHPEESEDSARYYIEWKGKPGALAYMIDKMYRIKDTIPEFTKIGKFFCPTYSNGKQQSSNYKGKDKEIIDKILKETLGR